MSDLLRYADLEVAATVNVTNTAKVFSDNAANQTATNVVAVNPIDTTLSITKTADRASYPIGDPIVYTITVTNTGTKNATGVYVDDNGPNEVTFSSVTTDPAGLDPTPIVNPHHVKVNLGTITPAQSVKVYINGTVTG